MIEETALLQLCRAQDALARLEAAAALASDGVQQGLRARLAYREAAGWLAHHGAWIHPVDLALRDAAFTGSYAAARLGRRLPSVLPQTVRQAGGAELTDVPEDQDVARAFTLARLWRRLAEMRGWSPLLEPGVFAQLGQGAAAEMPVPRPDLPPLLQAALAAREWSGGGQGGGQGGAGQGERADRLSLPGVFAAACLWRGAAGATGNPGLPLWSAPVQRLHRLALLPRPGWLAGFLDCVAEAAVLASRELGRLRAAEARAGALVRTARSHLPQAAALALRRPVITARELAAALRISPRAALGLVGALVQAGVLREATGRLAWRCYVVI